MLQSWEQADQDPGDFVRLAKQNRAATAEKEEEEEEEEEAEEEVPRVRDAIATTEEEGEEEEAAAASCVHEQAEFIDESDESAGLQPFVVGVNAGIRLLLHNHERTRLQ